MTNNKDKALIKLIIIVLVGYLGIHKFMEKKTALGWIYLFTFGLCGIGWTSEDCRRTDWPYHGWSSLERWFAPGGRSQGKRED